MKFASWNIEGRLTRFARDGRRGSPEHILQGIEKLDSDLLFLPEAFDNDRPIEPEVKDALEKLGYKAIIAAYNDEGDRQYAAVAYPHMLFLSRLDVVYSQEIRLGETRSMLMVDVAEPSTGQPIRVFGIHLDDRSEQNRLQQVNDLVIHINDSAHPVLAMGDFNAMHSDSLPARFLRNKAVLGAIDRLPHPRIQHLVQRLSEMAIGSTLHHIQTATNLIDADPKSLHTTTPKMRGQEWIPSVRLVKIDHMFASPEITMSNFAVARDGGSDHRAISATLRL